MKLIDVHGRLKKMGVPVFRTADVMAYLDIRKDLRDWKILIT